MENAQETTVKIVDRAVFPVSRCYYVSMVGILQNNQQEKKHIDRTYF